MPNRLVFTGIRQVAKENFDLPPLGNDQVQVRTWYSLMSTGTENIVFNRLYDPGTHWDTWVTYPFYPGYAAVGEVERTGAGVTQFKPGDRVVGRWPHASHYVAPAGRVYPLPEGFDPRQASWFTLALVAAMGARAAQFTLGETVAVAGAGPVGQMLIRWANAAGVESLIVIDPVAFRLGLAQRGGATEVIPAPVDQAVAAVRQANRGELPRVVVDATGHAPVFAQVLALAADRGRVVILGDTGAPAQQHLTSDVIRRGLSIVGAHGSHEDAQWNGNKIVRLFFHLVATGRFDLADLITHTFTPEQYLEAYSLANERRGETMGILFDWS